MSLRVPLLPVPERILDGELPPRQLRLGKRMPVRLRKGVVLELNAVRGQATVGVGGDCVVHTVGCYSNVRVPGPDAAQDLRCGLGEHRAQAEGLNGVPAVHRRAIAGEAIQDLPPAARWRGILGELADCCTDVGSIGLGRVAALVVVNRVRGQRKVRQVVCSRGAPGQGGVTAQKEGERVEEGFDDKAAADRASIGGVGVLVRALLIARSPLAGRAGSRWGMFERKRRNARLPVAPCVAVFVESSAASWPACPAGGASGRSSLPIARQSLTLSAGVDLLLGRPPLVGAAPSCPDGPDAARSVCTGQRL